MLISLSRNVLSWGFLATEFAGIWVKFLCRQQHISIYKLKIFPAGESWNAVVFKIKLSLGPFKWGVPVKEVLFKHQFVSSDNSFQHCCLKFSPYFKYVWQWCSLWDICHVQRGISITDMQGSHCGLKSHGVSQMKW